MNDRIAKLAQETDVWCDQNHYGNEFYDIRWEEHFAELIVKECISKYDEWAEHSKDKTSFDLARYNVKKHFGVKE
jgi:hypothetical protein